MMKWVQNHGIYGKLACPQVCPQRMLIVCLQHVEIKGSIIFIEHRNDVLGDANY